MVTLALAILFSAPFALVFWMTSWWLLDGARRRPRTLAVLPSEPRLQAWRLSDRRAEDR